MQNNNNHSEENSLSVLFRVKRKFSVYISRFDDVKEKQKLFQTLFEFREISRPKIAIDLCMLQWMCWACFDVYNWNSIALTYTILSALQCDIKKLGYSNKLSERVEILYLLEQRYYNMDAYVLLT